MKNYISHNIKYLCSNNFVTQNEFGAFFGLKKGVIGTYIRGLSNPQIETIQKICNYYSINIDDFINKELNKITYPPQEFDSDMSLKDKEVQEPSEEYINKDTIISELHKQLKDKDKIITLLERENRLLRGDDKTTKETA